MKVDGPDADRVADDTIKGGPKAPEIAKKIAEDPEKYDFGPGLRGDDPAPANVIEGPLAAPNWPGCQTRFLPVNFSSRRGQRIRGFGLHYTAGGNVKGYGDMIGLTGFASKSSAGVSWHFLIDREGHCYYSVPVSMKAWTIGNANGQLINVEVIGRGNEPDYAGPGMRKLAQVVQRAARIYKFPVRVGALRNCQVVKPGIVTHWQGGSCAGGHADIRPHDLAKVVRQLAAGGQKPLTAAARKACDTLNFHRKRAHVVGKWSAERAARAAALKKQIPAGRCPNRYR